MKKEDVPMLENVHLEKIIVLNVMMKEIYVKNVKMIIIPMKMVDALIQKIVRYLIKEFALNAQMIIF